MNLLETLGVQGGLLLAPMEDVTDISFRLFCKEFGADMVFTEFVNADGLVRSAKPTKTRLKLRIHPAERPIGIQIYGGNLDTMREAARITEAAGPDVLDINAGCWVKNVAMRGAGAGLLRDLPAMVEMARTIVGQVRLPVTLKTRLGWDVNSIRIVELARMLEDVGIQALTVHCRTRDQGHSGAADWSWIEKVKQAVSIPVILNGDVFTADDARRAFDTTGCDAVMIARGAITNPWIFREARHLIETGEHLAPPDYAERLLTAIRHLRLAAEYKGERRAVFEMRKHYAAYLRHSRNAKAMRMALMKPETLAESEDLLFSFLYAGDEGPDTGPLPEEIPATPACTD
ncbi:MAG: tRNA dihydrouridine synthase DusB [Ignavibacteriae bacterium]|nr:tRNA dihydrouridine synthase DusB [Ignavibacteriota bacterium]